MSTTKVPKVKVPKVKVPAPAPAILPVSSSLVSKLKTKIFKYIVSNASDEIKKSLTENKDDIKRIIEEKLATVDIVAIFGSVLATIDIATMFEKLNIELKKVVKITKEKSSAAKKVIAEKSSAAKKVIAEKSSAAKKVIAEKSSAAKKVIAEKGSAAKKVIAEKSSAAKKVIKKKIKDYNITHRLHYSSVALLIGCITHQLPHLRP
jgi:hypothetical protein